MEEFRNQSAFDEVTDKSIVTPYSRLAVTLFFCRHYVCIITVALQILVYAYL